MNKYLSLVLICSAVSMYAQNPIEKKLALANKIYETLTPDEKRHCDLIYREVAIHHARELRDTARGFLVPREINTEEDLSVVASEKTALHQKLNLPAAKLEKVCRISLIRMTALWRSHATFLGRYTTWPFTYEDQGEDLNFVVTNPQNESAS